MGIVRVVLVDPTPQIQGLTLKEDKLGFIYEGTTYGNVSFCMCMYVCGYVLCVCIVCLLCVPVVCARCVCPLCVPVVRVLCMCVVCVLCVCCVYV